MKKTDIIAKILDTKTRSAWGKGVKAYALDLLEDAPETLEVSTVKQTLLNGAREWSEYSYGGCAFIYDADIAERTCNASELKQTANGGRQPNRSESWLDVQTRALH